MLVELYMKVPRRCGCRYEDVINAGNLEEDTAPVEEEPPGPEVGLR